LAKTGEQAVDGVAVEAGQHGDLHGREVGRDTAGQTPELSLCDSRTDDVSIQHSATSLNETLVPLS